MKLTDDRIKWLIETCQKASDDGLGINITDPVSLSVLASEVLESRAAEERWRSNSRKTFDAMVAMRNDINEHIPLPSIDSDLARGPGNDVFCAEVAQGVVTALVAKDTEIERLTKERDEAIAALGEWARKAGSAEARVAKLEGALLVIQAQSTDNFAVERARAALGRDKT